ncbi:MAG: DNA repair protein RecN [Ruminococcaceae bacterium]|nr:DNA repair protein RecN [Oscillospiraceae bacterium]
MLQFLHIENIAVIEKADIELGYGMNVLTGETGAGKSIIIDSINAVLGERTSKELIREGADKAEVSAVFCDLDNNALSVLSENGFQADEEGKLLIRRTLTHSGSNVKIGGRPATVGVLREIGQSLLNIHGQHDNQNLLNPQKHCGYIDAVAQLNDEISDYYAEFKHLNSIRKELAALETDEDEKARKIDLLKYQINELESANIKLGEIDLLKERLKLAESHEKNANTISKIQALLSGDNDNNGIVDKLLEVDKLLNSLEIDVLKSDSAKLSETVFSIRDVAENIKNFALNNDFSADDIDIISERLDMLRRLMLKYGDTEEKMLDFLEKAKSELKDIELSDEKIEKLSVELDLATERLVKKAEVLTTKRTDAAIKFQKDVTSILTYLDMPDVIFSVDIKKGRYTKNGCDEIEFLISTNLGETVKPLHKIASGGELSRVMLGIKSVLSDEDQIGTLVFDEIDTGISGYAASKVATQLKKVSKNRQVLCVTHLAQIAAFADNHLLIQKNTENGRVYTKVSQLNYEDRIKEIARIMSGGEITDNLYNSAKELLDRSTNV